jgi:hypothetical protein
MTEPFYAWEDAEVTDLIALAERLQKDVEIFKGAPVGETLALAQDALKKAGEQIERLSLADVEDAAEIERLRALLREARPMIESVLIRGPEDLLARIDAELGAKP